VKKITGVFIFVALLVFSTTAFAQIKPGAFNVGPLVGGFIFEGNQDLKDPSPVFGVRAGYDFTEHWGVEATFNWVPTEYETSYPYYYRERRQKVLHLLDIPEYLHTDVYNYRIEGLYNFRPDKRLVPFIAVGVGGQSIDYDSTPQNKTRFAFDYGVGLKYFVTDSIAIRGDIRHILAIGSLYNDLEATVGIAFYFGGKKAPVEEMKKAPEAAPVMEQKMLGEGRAKLDIEFDFDKSNVRPQYHDEIKQVADFMIKYPDTKVAIEGHTDNIGTAEYNQKLSERRANSVKNYIIDNFGIDAKRLRAEGFGETRPIADNNTDEGRQRNRRVESVLIKLDKN
jgi:OOP family OmpA-OmpF porin